MGAIGPQFPRYAAHLPDRAYVSRLIAIATAGLSVLMVAVGLISSGKTDASGRVATAPAPPQLPPSEAAEDAGHPKSQNGAEADAHHDDPPNPGRKIVHSGAMGNDV